MNAGNAAITGAALEQGQQTATAGDPESPAVDVQVIRLDHRWLELRFDGPLQFRAREWARDIAPALAVAGFDPSRVRTSNKGHHSADGSVSMFAWVLQ
jgi:hypothetical protein